MPLTFLPFPAAAVPPKRVVLEEPPPRRAGSAVSLACTAEDSNPRTTLLWFRGSGEPILDAGTLVDRILKDKWIREEIKIKKMNSIFIL